MRAHFTLKKTCAIRASTPNPHSRNLPVSTELKRNQFSRQCLASGAIFIRLCALDFAYSQEKANTFRGPPRAYVAKTHRSKAYIHKTHIDIYMQLCGLP